MKKNKPEVSQTLDTSTLKHSSDALSRTLTFISRWSIYLLVFLMPFFILPGVVNSIYLAKQFLAGVLILLSVIALTIRVLFKGDIISFIKVKLSGLLFIFAAGVGLSSFLSGAKYLSFWGFGGSEPFTGLSVAIIVLFFFLGGSLFAREEFIKKTVFLFTLSSVILLAVVEVAILLTQVFKIDYFIRMFGQSVFNPFGSINALAVFAATSLVFAVGVLFSQNFLKKGFKILLSLQALLSLAAVLIIGYRNIYLAVAITTFLFLIILFYKHKKDFIKRINIPLLIFVVFLLLFIFSVSFSVIFSAPLEVSPGPGLSFSVGWKTMTSGIKDFVLGSGPSTFAYDFARYKPDALNQTGWWNVRFTSGFAALPTLMSELGLVGLLSLGVFLLYNLFLLLRLTIASKSKAKSKNDAFLTGISLSFVLLFISLFVYPLNFATFFYLMFFLIMALAIEGIAKEEWRQFSFDTLPHRALSAVLALIAVLVVAVFILFIFSRHFKAETSYTEGLRALSRGDSEMALNGFREAIRWYHDDTYYRTTAVVLVREGVNKLQSQAINQESAALIQKDFQQGIALAKQATQINPLERENWFSLGAIYENLIPFVAGASEAALEAYNRVEELEPANPLTFLARGRTYLASAKLLEQSIKRSRQQNGAAPETIKNSEDKLNELLSKSLEELNEAKEKKPNLETVYLVLAEYYEFTGDFDLAEENLTKARLINPRNIDSLVRLGRILYNNKKYDKSIEAMNNILKVLPNNSNAKFILGLSHDALGENDKALKIFKELADSEPDNEKVREMLNNLQRGRSVAGGDFIELESETSETAEGVIEEVGEEGGE